MMLILGDKIKRPEGSVIEPLENDKEDQMEY